MSVSERRIKNLRKKINKQFFSKKRSKDAFKRRNVR